MLNMRISFQRVLCPTDLGPESNQALRYAVALCRAYRAELLLYHCARPGTLANATEVRRIGTLMEDSIKPYDRSASEHVPIWQARIVEGDPVLEIHRQQSGRPI
jgi:hypothetical protein